MTTSRWVTTEQRIDAAPASPAGYRTLRAVPGRAHVRRTDLAAVSGGDVEVLLTVAHLSDLHVCDAQSSARVEFIARWADLDLPTAAEIGELGTYRAQEFLSAQVVDAMVQAVNSVGHGPVGGAPVDLAVCTGDNTDNAQANELDWYLALLDGGTVVPDSGATDRYEGVADDTVEDDRYWHPDAGFADLPRSRFGFPVVPGVLDAARAAFDTPGLDIPWLAAHGNHDGLVQGTWPRGDARSLGTTKPIALAAAETPEHDRFAEDPIALLRGLGACDPVALAYLRAAVSREITGDPRRRITTLDEFVAAHFTATARPRGHGFADDHRPYYRHDPSPEVAVLVLNTVNVHGGWQGSLDAEQLAWLDAELTEADQHRRYAVLAGHHPLATLTNDRWAEGTPRRVLSDELAGVLARHPSLVLWLNGHTHQTSVTPHGTWWEVTAPSLIDWPQQARIVELLRGNGTITVAATMLDHAGDLPWSGAIDTPIALAGLSRELAANDWQAGPGPLDERWHTGATDERNVLLALPDPWAGLDLGTAQR